MSTKRTTQSVIALLLIGAVTSILYFSIESYEKTIENSWSKEASTNHFLAAQKFFQKNGINSVNIDSLARLNSLDQISTLLITDAQQITNPRQQDKLLDWVINGGHLIVGTPSENINDDLLLKMVSLHVKPHDHINSDEYDDKGSESDTHEYNITESLREYNRQIDEDRTVEEIQQILTKEEEGEILTTVNLNKRYQNIQAKFNLSIEYHHPFIEGEWHEKEDELEATPHYWARSNHDDIHLIQFERGNGIITFVTTAALWNSWEIEKHDHALLLWALSNKYGDLAILRHINQDSLGILAMRYLSELLVAIVISIIMWLLYIGHRFGRIVPHNTTERRALNNHLFASANYLWHKKEQSHLLSASRQNIQRRARIVLPQFSQADEKKRCELLAQHCQNTTPLAVYSALHDSHYNETNFVRTVKLLQQIEQSL